MNDIFKKRQTLVSREKIKKRQYIKSLIKDIVWFWIFALIFIWIVLALHYNI